MLFIICYTQYFCVVALLINNYLYIKHKIMSKEMRRLIDDFNKFVIKEESNSVEKMVSKYIEDTEYDIKNSLGNCSFFTRDVINWAKKNGIKADYIYMPMSEEYRRKNKIGKDFGGNDSDWEDHIVPMINGKIIDFTYTDSGVSRKVRKQNTILPLIVTYDKSLFEPSGIYGKYGYTKSEKNTEYGNSKDINQFKVTKPRKKSGWVKNITYIS